MDKKDLGFELVHVGINQPDNEEAMKTVHLLSSLFGFDYRETPGSWFVNDQFEVLKMPFLGKNGHIAIAANDSQAAYEYLKSQGVEFNEESAGYLPDGRLNTIYLKDDIAGFAFHLVQKKQ